MHDDHTTVDFPVRQWFGVVEMGPHQLARDGRSGGRTTAAAGRLAGYRLRKALRDAGWSMVGPVEISVNDDLFTDRRHVAALAPCIGLPVWTGPLPDTRRGAVRAVVPSFSATAEVEG